MSDPTIARRPAGSPHLRVEDEERIAELADLAQHACAFFFQVPARYELAAIESSINMIERTAAEQETGPSGVHWTPAAFGSLQTTVWLYLSAAAEHLDGIAAALETGAALHPPQPLTRSAYELSTRAFWLLDSECSLRQRVARAHIDVFASLERQIQATPKGESDEVDAHRRELKQALKHFRDRQLPDAFGVAFEPPDRVDSSHVVLDGESNLSPTDAAKYFTDGYWGPTEGSWSVYSVLCLGSHANMWHLLQYAQEHTPEVGVVGRRYVVDVETLEQLVVAAIQPFVASVGLLWSWNGWNMDEISTWCARINSSLPRSVPSEW